MAKIMDANQGQPPFAPCLLPTIVFHRVDAPAPKRKDPDWMNAALRFNDRPSHIVQDHNMRSFGFEGFRRNYEHASSYLRDENLPRPLQSAHVTVTHAGVHGE